MNSIDISVVMSVYNAEDFLDESIISILNQSFKRFELIIINDGSTDNSLKLINAFSDSRIKLIDQENTGLSKALNKGISLARGKYIARMDADDISLRDRLQIQFDFLENNIEFVVVGSNAIFMNKKGEPLYNSRLPLIDQDIKKTLPLSPFFHSATMFRKEFFLKCRGYNEDIKHYFEDRLLWNNMAEYGKFHNIEIPLLKYRLVPGSISSRNQKDNLIFENICNRVIKNNAITKDDLITLESLHKEISKNVKKANYYLHIGKIHLEHNFNRRKAIVNLLISLYFNVGNKITLFNLLLSFSPFFVIKYWKKKRGVFVN
jgi:glycosyltransferase involved in cell wall biosynthesis